jgi:GT2 family glycosyltransferase
MMKVLGHIHTFNDESVIDHSLQALLDQTYPLEEILLVDNGSTDGTLNRAFPKKVSMIRHLENRGTSGAVVTGMGYAIKTGYDWIWIFDADSAPRRDGLEKLLELYQSFPSELQASTWLLASLPMDAATGEPRYGARFPSGRGMRDEPKLNQEAYECDITIWTGCLYKLAAVQRVGLPRADYVLDWGEFEYAYRGKRGGYRTFMHPNSIVDHNIGGQPSVIGFPPIRLYYYSRNLLYFWFYEYYQGNIFRFLTQPPSAVRLIIKVLLTSRRSWLDVLACLRGVWDGLCKNMHHRY